MLLTNETLLDRLYELTKKSIKIEVAVAWANECAALDRLLEFGRTNGALRAIVGVSGNATHPNALRVLQRSARLRIHPSMGGIFHPKLYLFHLEKKSIAWIGSANLTRPGFEQNKELVIEIEDFDHTAAKWFEDCWAGLSDDEGTEELLKDYEDQWEPPSPPRSTYHEGSRPRRNTSTFAAFLTNWPSFVVQLIEADLFWGRRWNDQEAPVTGETGSWLETITIGRRVIVREDWSDLGREDRNVILGRSPHGYLGSMKGAGRANNIFCEASRENLAVRRTIRRALQSPIDASEADFALAACDFIGQVNRIPGFAGALATRFLTLARPDRAVSVNNGSRRKLAELTNLPESTLSNPPGGRNHSYLDLLHWFEEQDWYSNPVPASVRERLLAQNRAALFDAFVYREQRN